MLLVFKLKYYNINQSFEFKISKPRPLKVVKKIEIPYQTFEFL